MRALTILKQIDVYNGLNVAFFVFLPVGSRSESQEVADNNVRFCCGEGARAGGRAVSAAVAQGATAPPVDGAVLGKELLHLVLLVEL